MTPSELKEVTERQRRSNEFLRIRRFFGGLSQVMDQAQRDHAERLARRRQYCLGYSFSFNLKRVCLVHKLSPAWQAGLWNALGGKIDPGETPVDAMVREFAEEAGVQTTACQWNAFGSLSAPDYVVHLFWRIGERLEPLSYMEERTGQIMRQHQVCKLPIMSTVAHLQWLVPIAQSAARARQEGKRIDVPLRVDAVFSHDGLGD